MIFETMPETGAQRYLNERLKDDYYRQCFEQARTATVGLDEGVQRFEDLWGQGGIPHQLELVVVAGSHSYGLATADSDVDFRGCFSTPTVDLLGLTKTPETWGRTGDVDAALHEVGKFLRLALAANPTILEVLFNPLVVYNTEFGKTLRLNAVRFLSNRARNTFGGYARQQFKRLVQRNGTFDPNLAKRTEKHARHLFRLIETGGHLLTTGEFRLRTPDPDRLFELGRLPMVELVAEAERHLAWYDNLVSVLPDEPDTAWVNDLLVEFRRHNWE